MDVLGNVVHGSLVRDTVFIEHSCKTVQRILIHLNEFLDPVVLCMFIVAFYTDLFMKKTLLLCGLAVPVGAKQWHNTWT